MKTLETLLPRLIRATEEGRLKWQSAQISGFETALPNATTLRIYDWQDEDTGVEGVRLVLKATNVNQLAGKVGDLDFVDASELEPGNNALFRLLMLARRSANNVESIINEIEQFLS